MTTSMQRTREAVLVGFCSLLVTGTLTAFLSDPRPWDAKARAIGSDRRKTLERVRPDPGSVARSQSRIRLEAFARGPSTPPSAGYRWQLFQRRTASRFLDWRDYEVVASGRGSIGVSIDLASDSRAEWLVVDSSSHARCSFFLEARFGDLDVDLAPGRDCRIRVRDARSKAPVRALLVDERGAPFGFLEAPGLRLELPFSGYVLSDGYTAAAVLLTERKADVVLELQRLASARGRLRGPVSSGDRLHYLALGGRFTAAHAVDEEGRFRLAPVPAGPGYLRFTGRNADFPDGGLSIVLRDGEQDLGELELAPFGSLDLTLLGTREARAGQAFLEVHFPGTVQEEYSRGIQWPVMQLDVDENGRASVFGFRTREVSGTVWTTAGGLGLLPCVLATVSGCGTPVTVPMQSPGTVHAVPDLGGTLLPRGCRVVLADRSYGLKAEAVLHDAGG
ncbi:MAG: hypothetical protein ACE5F1_10080, partial [Planctomycetota bacterium]